MSYSALLYIDFILWNMPYESPIFWHNVLLIYRKRAEWSNAIGSGFLCALFCSGISEKAKQTCFQDMIITRI